MVIGIDLGAAHITIALTNLQGNIKVIQTQKFNASEDPQGAIEYICKQGNILLQGNGRQPRDVLGIGIAAPAPLEGEKLDMLSPVILPQWEGFELVPKVKQAFGLPVYIDNDANAGAIAEKWWGSGRGVSNLVYIKLGTGVGAGLIINDKIFKGTGGTAGEIGHTTINVKGPMCRCGNRGCLESYLSNLAILDETEKRLNDYPASRLHQEDLIIENLVEAAQKGDELAVDVIVSAGKNLGIAIANLLNLVNPELIILGGDIVEAGEVFADAVRSTAFNRSISKAANEVTIMASGFKQDSIVVGAATLAIYQAFLPINIRRTLSYDGL
jgi:glucokinase-like ROK family protein